MADRANLIIELVEDDAPRAGPPQAPTPQGGGPPPQAPPQQQQGQQQQTERQDPFGQAGWSNRADDLLSRPAPAWREDPFERPGAGGMRNREDPFERLSELLRERHLESLGDVSLGSDGGNDRKTVLMERDVELREEDLRLRRLEKARRDNTFGGGVSNWANDIVKMVGSPMTAISGAGLSSSAGGLGNRMRSWAADAPGILKRFRKGIGRKAHGVRKGGMLAGAGGMLKQGLRMAGPAGIAISTFASAASSFKKAVESFIQRGLELSAYSGDLAGSAARKQVRELLDDINEAQVTGKNVARLMDSWGRLKSIWKRNVETPVKDAAAGVLADITEHGPPAVMAAGSSLFGIPMSGKDWADMIKKAGDQGVDMSMQIENAQRDMGAWMLAGETWPAVLQELRETKAVVMKWFDEAKGRFDRDRMKEDVAINEALGGFFLPARVIAGLRHLQPPGANMGLIDRDGRGLNQAPQHVRFE